MKKTGFELPKCIRIVGIIERLRKTRKKRKVKAKKLMPIFVVEGGDAKLGVGWMELSKRKQTATKQVQTSEQGL